MVVVRVSAFMVLLLAMIIFIFLGVVSSSCSLPGSGPILLLSPPYLFLGYGLEHKGYRRYDLVVQRIHISRDVTFDESTPFYAAPQSTVSPTPVSLSSFFQHLLLTIPPL